MGLLTARLKLAERMMTQAAEINRGIEITFADGCQGLIPFGDIPEVGRPSDLSRVELPNPYQVNIRGSKGELVDLPWDFVSKIPSPLREKVDSLVIYLTIFVCFL